jgi:hypothetical protein
MPGTKRHLSFMLPNLTDGRYRLGFKAVMGTRALPQVVSEYVVSHGVPKPLSEVNQLAVTPITVQPSGIGASIPPGGSRSITLRVTNNAKRKISLDMVPHAVEQTLNGSVGLGSRTLPIGLDVKVSANSQPMEAGETRIVRVVASLDAKAAGDMWFALAIKERDNGLSLAETVYGNISVPNSSKPMVAIETPKLVMDGKTPVAIKFQLHNSGNTALRPEPSATVLEGGVRLVERPAVPLVGDGGLLPGSIVDNVMLLPQNLKPGEYIVEIAYQYGDKEFAKARIPITIFAPKASNASRPKGG